MLKQVCIIECPDEIIIFVFYVLGFITILWNVSTSSSSSLSKEEDIPGKLTLLEQPNMDILKMSSG